VISGRTNTVTATIRVTQFPVGVATDPRTGRIYVTQDSNQVPVISGRTDTVVARVRVPFRATLPWPRTRGPTPSTPPTPTAGRSP